MNGVKKEYYESGELRYEWPYKDGKQHGISKGYSESGKLEYVWPYTDGKRNGISKGYTESGGLQYEYPYKDGKQHGLDIEYDKDGSVDSYCYWWYDTDVTEQVERIVDDIFHITEEEMIIIALSL